MNRYSLYFSQYCYFCQKVLMFLHGREHQIELSSTADPTHFKTLVAGGGKSQVPCLSITSDDGSVVWMYESDDIIGYLKKTFCELDGH